MPTFLAKHLESFSPRAGHIDIGSRSQIREKLKISMSTSQWNDKSQSPKQQSVHGPT